MKRRSTASLDARQTLPRWSVKQAVSRSHRDLHPIGLDCLADPTLKRENTLKTLRTRSKSAISRLRRRYSEREEEFRQLSIDIEFMTRGHGIRHSKFQRRDIERFDLWPSVVDFEQQVLGRPVELTISLQNVGVAPARFRLKHFKSDSIYVSFEKETTILAAGMTHVITIHLRPKKLGLVRENLHILAGECQEFCIPVFAEVLESIPEPELDKAALDFRELVPRLPYTCFNWKEEKLIVERDTLAVLDAAKPLEEVVQMDQALERKYLSTKPPNYCVRVFRSLRPESEHVEEKKEKEWESALNPEIHELLNCS